MEHMYKKIVLLYIICGDEILMRKFYDSEQGYEIIDIFAFKIENNFEDESEIERGIHTKLTALFGRSFPYQYRGTIEGTINKEGVVAHITSQTYTIHLDEKEKVQENYADDVVDDGGALVWIHKNEIPHEKRLREGDKMLIERVFQNKSLNIEKVEDQGDSWIDAKVVSWKEKI